MAFALPYLAQAAIGALIGGGVSSAQGGSFGRGAGIGALGGLGGGIGGALGGSIGSGIGAFGGTLGGQAAVSNEPDYMQAGLAGLASGADWSNGGGVGNRFVSGFSNPGTTASSFAGGVNAPVAPTFMQKLGGGFKGALGMGSVGDVSGKPLMNVPQSQSLMQPSIASRLGQGGVTGSGSELARQQVAGFGANQAMPGGTGATTSQNPLGDLLGFGGEAGTKNLPQTLLGAGISGIGQLMKPQQQFPSLGGAGGTQSFKNLLSAGPKGVQVSDELKSQLDDEIQGKYDQLTQRIQQKYKQLRPGSDYLNDSQYQEEIKELEADQQDEMKNAVANYQESQYQTQLQGAQYFSQMDTYELMGQTGLDVQSAQEFQDWLRTIGGGLFQSGLGMM